MISNRTTALRVMIAIAIVVALAIAAGSALWSILHPTDWMLDEAAERFPGIVFKIDTDERAVALTFDDAPHPDVTPGLLDVLASHDVKATFFAIGSYARNHPELVEAIRAGGHELANHLYTERMSAALSDDEFVRELLQTDSLIAPAGPPKWCRPGSGVLTNRIIRLIKDNGYIPVLGTAYPVDLVAGVDLTVKHVVDNLRPGAIFVLHDGPGREHNIEVLSSLLPRIDAEGYRVVTLIELSRLGPPVLENP